MRLTRRGRLVLLLFFFGLIAGGAGSAYVFLSSIGLIGDSDPHGKIDLTINEGMNMQEIGELLESSGVVASELGFRLAVRLDGLPGGVQAGRYELPLGLTARDALDALEEGPIVEFTTVTIPEGSWLEDFATAVGEATHIKRSDFMRVLRSGKIRSKLKPDDVSTLEGLLFPSTYQVIETDDARTVAQRFADEFTEQFSEIDSSKAEKMGYSPYEIVIVASMIEAETKVASERAKVARVIYNRLEVGEKLGIDATVIYALGEHTESLTLSDLEVDSPYNTRLYPGLPPTPIGAPGRAALEAAARPADGEWFYYVLADCDGNHAFSVSYDEFLVNKNAYQALEC